MTPTASRLRHPNRLSSALLALLCAALLVPGEGALLAQEAPTPAAAAAAEPAPVKLPADQLDSLVAPIALYPDPLLAQTLVASTYPLEIVQLQQWLAKHKDLKDKALADAVAKQPWDPSIQSMAAVPEVVKRLADDIQWTTDLGNAFLAQQSDVMDAVQRMRKKAQDKGALESNEQQKVETKVVEEKTVIVVEPTNPEVVYVPSYSPTVVYGAAYLSVPADLLPALLPRARRSSPSASAWRWGAAIWGGSCCGCGWGGNNVNINVNNNFNTGQPRTGQRGRGQGAGGGNWQHNAQHRGGAPYANKATANKYGGSARGDVAGQRGRAPAAAVARAGVEQPRQPAAREAAAAAPASSDRPRAGGGGFPAAAAAGPDRQPATFRAAAARGPVQRLRRRRLRRLQRQQRRGPAARAAPRAWAPAEGAAAVAGGGGGRGGGRR